MRKILVSMLMVVVLLFNEGTISAYAATDVTASTFGFNIDNSYYNMTWYTSVHVVNVWKGSVLIGQAYQQVGVARRKSNQKYQTVVVRFMMCPEDTKSLGTWYHGINKVGKISMKLSSKQKYVDNAPDSSIVTYSDSCSFSLGGSVNSKGEFSGNLGIGASTSWSNNCFDIVSKVTNNQKTITTSYNYTPTWNIFSTSGRKKVNRWLNSTHKEYAMFQYENDTTKIPDFKITYTATMWYATSSKKNWDGDTWDVFPYSKTTTRTIPYYS